MQIDDWSACPDLVDVYRDIRELGLEQNLAELEAFGYTVVEGALTPQQTSAMRDRIVALAEKRLGKKLDLDSETQHQETKYAQYLLFEDPMFKEAVTNPRTLALIRYLLGKKCILSSLGSHVKGPGGPGLLLHSDNGNGYPDPFPPYSQVANVNFCMTDYTEARGAIAMVPGSHRHGRQVTPSERGLDGNERNPHAIPLEVPAGTAVVFHGNTWHGSFPRKVPGLRVNLAAFYCREYIQPQEDRHHVPDGFLDGAKDDVLARLLGRDLIHGWKEEGPTKLYERREADSGKVKSWQS
jgi:ectoine hydroxylase-related dioxygenase (phytanoyl-CoA dioxygenase family)